MEYQLLKKISQQQIFYLGYLVAAKEARQQKK